MSDYDKLRIAVVCSSNQNRSMEAHSCLSKKGFNVKSYGTGSQVKLPGPAPNMPNIYDFNTTYDEMYKDLLRKDPELNVFRINVCNAEMVQSAEGPADAIRYKQNGILHMLDRNRRIKPKPQRFQSCKETFDVIVSCEERVYDQIMEDLDSREKTDCTHPVHIINIDIQDNHEEATIGAFIIKDLVTTLSECDDLDNEIDEIIQDFEHSVSRPILHYTWFV